LRSTLQYCFKPIEIDTWTVTEIKQFEELKRVKLSDCFGALRGLRVVEDFSDEQEPTHPLFVGCPCPECGEPLRRIKISWRGLDGFTAIPRDRFLKSRAGPLRADVTSALFPLLT
jgi:hypothetical protein